MRKNAIKKINKFYDKIEFMERISSIEVLKDDLEKVAYDLNEFIEEYDH